MPDKKRCKIISRDRRENVGVSTGLYDSQNSEIMTGDLVEIISSYTIGRVFWNRYEKAYGVYYGCRYGDGDVFSVDSYGRFIKINSDQGMKMDLIIIYRDWE